MTHTHHQISEGSQTLPPQTAWVVFSGKTDLAWLRILKPGFRHCYVLMNDGRSWYTVDPMSNFIDVNVHHHVPPEFDLPRWLEERGLRILRCPIQRPKTPAPWMLFTCVEAVKRLLGVHSRRILTPWQLYCHLARREPPRFANTPGAESSSVNTLTPHYKGDLSWEV
jgi:hypothetical protein